MTYRNKRLTDLARGQSCVECGANDGTTVWAHSNLLEHGKGRGIKAHDAAGMFLCARCHAELDSGTSMSREEKRDFIMRNIVRTHTRLWDLGLVRVA